MEDSTTAALPVPLTPSPEPNCLSGTPAAYQADMASPSQYPGHLKEDLHAMLQALPMRLDIEAWTSRLLSSV